MKKSKKIIGIILCIILIASVTTAIFVATATAKKVEISITADKTELSAGETATISVTVNANFPVATMSIPVFYDNTLVDVSDATSTLTDYAVKSAVTDTQSADISKVFANTGLSSDKYGFVLVNYIGGAGAEVPETTDGVVLTFKITAKAGVSGTEVVKCVSQSAKTDDNIAGMLYFGATINENLIDAIPENIENIDLANAQANVVVSNEGTALIANTDTTAVVDNANKYVYGVPAGIGVEDMAEYFIVTNGTFEMVANEAGYTNGTGATLVVKDLDGNEVAQYTLVIFGDVSGDGAITMADYGMVSMVSLGGAIDGEASNYAADVNGDGAITMADYGIVNMASLGGEITVNPYAE